MALYKVTMYLSGLEPGLTVDQLDRKVYANTKHADFYFTVEDVLEEDEEQD